MRRLGFCLLLLLAPQVARAAEAPEDLLSGATQVYLRWDGVDAHRAAYEKTALGKMIQGDTGKFVTNLFSQLQDNLGALLTVEQLLKGLSPAQLGKLLADAKEAPKLAGLLTRHGFILAVEFRKLEPFSWQVTLIIPEAGAAPAPLFGTLRLAAGLAEIPVKEVTVKEADRKVRHLEVEGVHVTAWVDGTHLVLAAGTDPPEAVVQAAHGKGGRLTSNPLFRRVADFKQFETAARGFVDVTSMTRLARTRNKDVAKLLDDLGLDAVKCATLYSGFDGDADRGLIELEATGGNQGLFKLASGKPFTLGDVPPLPLDVTSWSMTNFDLAAFYDLGLLTAENVVRLVAPEDVAKVQELTKHADAALGLDIRKDLLDSLGNRFAMYSSPAEGPLSIGQTFLIQVRDPEKLQGALARALKNLGRVTGVDISVKKKTYHGVDIREVQVRQQGFFFVPSYAVHKGWLAFSYFPQPVQGYVLRANGELPAWKPDAETAASLAKLPREFVSISVSDPRPTVKQLLSLGPIVAGSVKSFFPDTKFDVGAVPNSHEATRHLFPNVSVVSLRGQTLRVDSRSSLELPIDLAGIDNYALFAVFFAFASFAF